MLNNAQADGIEEKPVRTATLLERVASLKYADIPRPNDAGGVDYHMVVVTHSGKQVYMPCTKGVYGWFMANRPDQDKKSDFVLEKDPSTRLIIKITKQPRADALPAFKREDPERENSRLLIVALHSDNSTSLIHVPERINEQTIESIRSAIADTEDKIESGVKVGSYTVLKVVDTPGLKELHIDPISR